MYNQKVYIEQTIERRFIMAFAIPEEMIRRSGGCGCACGGSGAGAGGLVEQLEDLAKGW